MRVVIQRVLRAMVTIDGELKSSVEKGLLVFVGIEEADDVNDVEWLGNKIINLRIFDDENKVPNISVKDSDGDILLVSQFTLHALTKKGNRPSYIKAAGPDMAIALYDSLIVELQKNLGKKIYTGVFGADMKIELVNDGPVTIFIDSKNKE
ncbi:MAG: D-tyrosyl-tRNA(Tyr) deacylase [Ferruginibacter sp.]|nr:D-tyrosyl-tRNA(Tyr) deacylase [Ferruginibacter sp.]